MMNKFFSSDDAGEYCGGRSKKTMERWRWEGKGPKFHKFGRSVLYSKADLDAFIDSCRRHSTSDPGPQEVE